MSLVLLDYDYLRSIDAGAGIYLPPLISNGKVDRIISNFPDWRVRITCPAQ